MAERESDRHDFFAEAANLNPRGEVLLAEPLPSQGDAADVGASGTTVLLGFHRAGDAALYWSLEEIYHFTGDGRLRRAFLDGRPVKAERGTLVSLERVRGEGESSLVRRPYSAEETRLALQKLEGRIERLRSAAAEGFALGRTTPSEEAFLVAATEWLAGLPANIDAARDARP